MKLLQKYALAIVLTAFTLHLSAQRATISLQGTVKDQNHKPLDFVTVKLKETERVIYTNEEGKFSFNIDPTGFKTLTISFAMVGKAGKDTTITAANFTKAIAITMQELNLRLNEVKIIEERKILSSNSSIVFGRQAIEQIQAFSLADILNNLPGKTITPPNLQNPLNITLRGEATGIHSLNNSLGVSIILDDIQQSNNANMQNRSVGKFGMVGSGISSKNFGSFDVPFGGIDIREIPADNIESIEVISGVAPVKYGDLTDGAVIINQKAGRTKYQFTSRINAATTNFSLSKGFQLPSKAGALNLSLNYLLSEQDPSDPLKSYKRISSGLMWSSNLSKDIKNTLSVNYNTRLDNVKKDPDVGQDYLTYAKSRNLSISNRTAIQINSKLVKSLNMSVGYSAAFQETYNQIYLNGPPAAIADKDTTGIYEGYFAPGNYLSVEHIKGKPENLNGNISLSNDFMTGEIRHNISVGSNIYYAANKGQGVIVDPERPRWENLGYQNERPYDYESLPSVFNYSLYLEDGINFNFFKRRMTATGGIRYDVQNGFGTLQPRINMNYPVTKNFGINAAYGTSTKSPSLSHRYPAPVYYDLPLVNYYTGYTIESLFLVYTDKVIIDNSRLKPSKSKQLEFGLNYKNKFLTTSLTGYYKQSTDGFSNLSVPVAYTLNQYDYIYHQGARPDYYPNGKTKTWIAFYNATANDLKSTNLGLEWLISTRKIKSIETSFNLSSAFSYTTSSTAYEQVLKADASKTTDDNLAWFGVFKGAVREDYSLTSKLASTTHIPKIGFVINLRTDIFLQKQGRILNTAYLPIAYLDKNLQRYDIENYDPNDPVYNYLAQTSRKNSVTKQPFVYANLSLSVAKEIGKYIRMSLNANNVFNIRNRYYDPKTDSVTSYTYPVSVGAELSIKF